MKPKISIFMLAATGLAMGQGKPNAAAGSYYRMKLVKIVDTQGFGQRVEVVRFLIPADWRSEESSVTWDGREMRCPANMIKVRFQAASPDGLSGVQIVPGKMWLSASEPMMLQIMRNSAASGQGCDVGPVLNSIAYLRQTVVPGLRPGARVVSAEAMPAVSEAKQALLAQTYGPLVQAGYLRGFQADAGAVKVEYSQNGQAVTEWITTGVTSIASRTPSRAALMQGQVVNSASTFSIISEGVFALRMPAGRFDNKLAATIVASMRPNPVYQAAVSNFLAGMNKTANDGAMARARIWREAGQQMSATISQSYQNQQAVQDRSAAQFSQTIRGVETFVNPSSGERVELSGGYDNAWVNRRGEYLLSDSPGFNAPVVLQEDWTQLRKAPR